MILFYLLFATFYTPPDYPKISAEFESELSNRAPNSIVKVWVFFTDKGKQSNYKEAIKLAEQSLTPKARRRRLKIRKVGELCDFTDLPVCSEYINELSNLGCSFKLASKFLNAASFVIEVNKIPVIATKPWVRKIEPVGIFYASKDEFIGLKGISYGYSKQQLEQLKINEAHEMGYTGEGVLIGILDTGFEWRRNKVLKGIKVVAEYDFIGGDTCVSYEPEQIDTIVFPDSTIFYQEPEEQIRHGTAMLTLLGARKPGQDGFIGAAFNASFALAKTEILYNPRTGGGEDIIMEEDWWIAGVEWLDNLGADIISNSLGYKIWWKGPTFAYDSLDGKHYKMSKLASSLWSKGILFVTAMGNRTREEAKPDTCIVAPADADSILAVGGVDTLGNWIYWDSARPLGGIKGPRCDSAIKPEVCGPWIGMYGIPYPYPYYDSSSNWEGHGTSCATALVAGACALVLEAHPAWGAMEVRKSIIQSASLWPSYNDSLGFGIVNAKKAIGTPDVPKPPLDRNKLLAPYPSPFKPGYDELTLPYQLVNNTYVRIRIYTLSGKLIWEKQIDDDVIGYHDTIKWNGKSGTQYVASGVYICLLETGYGKDIKKFSVVR